MCHSPLFSATIFALLSAIDWEEARHCQAQGCPHCGGTLHVSNYERKPRCFNRHLLGECYEFRWSFCCAGDNGRECRRRTTPASVRFLGRKVYLGILITLISALEHGLTPTRRQRLIDELELSAQTLYRWRCWWTAQLPMTRHWRSLAGLFSPPLDTATLPSSLLHQLQGELLGERIKQLLVLIRPVTTSTGAQAM